LLENTRAINDRRALILTRKLLFAVRTGLVLALCLTGGAARAADLGGDLVVAPALGAVVEHGLGGDPGLFRTFGAGWW